MKTPGLRAHSLAKGNPERDFCAEAHYERRSFIRFLNQIENISEQFAPPTPDQHRSALLFYNYLL